MKSYKYAALYFSDPFVELISTDSQVLDWILAELKKVRTGLSSSTMELPSGEKYWLRIRDRQHKHLEVVWWMLKQLCLQGWEPFAINDIPLISLPHRFCYHLRLESNAK